MTRKEAVYRIENHITVHRIGLYPHVKLGEALNMAIESLEKGIPIRPIMRIEEKGFNKGRIYPHCPICDTMPVSHPNVSYCDKCGQAIDWSELE